ncbi:signal peptide peptidase SppA [Candidatus Micrarchaeota archaeon]|nr:signal peptide peptidase SppA [Candidatus Micrarchaeota archaeon]
MNRFGNNGTRSKSRLILGTGVLLVLVFLAVILLFFVFSSFTPSLVGKCVAVVEIDEPLTVEGSPPTIFESGYPSSDNLAEKIDALNRREDVGAVLFIINSPGGTVVATGEVYDSVKNLDKPKVAYLREVAASGAYYVAAGNDYIISDPNALTGSIGVVSTTFQLSGLLDKLGVNVTSVKSGPYKDIASPYRNLTPEEEEILQGLVDEIYEEFRSVVRENRRGKLDMDLFDEVTDGRILSGRQAHKAGLVDGLGNKDDALMKAAELGNISAESPDDIRVCYVSTGYTEGGLFSIESMLEHLRFKASSPAVYYE